jgi:hypothetical protein
MLPETHVTSMAPSKLAPTSRPHPPASTDRMNTFLSTYLYLAVTDLHPAVARWLEALAVIDNDTSLPAEVFQIRIRIHWIRN